MAVAWLPLDIWRSRVTGRFKLSSLPLLQKGTREVKLGVGDSRSPDIWWEVSATPPPLHSSPSVLIYHVHCMSYRSYWGSYICPMSYFLAGAMRNECSNNSRVLSTTITYEDVSNQYGYHLSLPAAILAIFVMGLAYKILWLGALRLQDIAKRRTVRRKVLGIRKRARRLLKATLRWREDYTSAMPSMRLEEDALAEIEIS
jgi:hypothetical protein